MEYTIENGLVYKTVIRINTTEKILVGSETYEETTDTEIITYTFDLELGQYIETGRRPAPVEEPIA